jgi:hypothetical protein
MTDLRKAAEMAVDWFDGCQVNGIDDTYEAAVAAAEALRQALEQPEQEPVAWVDAKPDGYDFWGLREVPFGKHYLYTAPPKRERSEQREWVGLTDEEKGWCVAPSLKETMDRFEAKLKEKNT